MLRHRPPARRRDLFGLACVVAALAVASTPAVAAKNPRPATVPAVRAWSGGSGAFKLTAGARVVASKALRREAKLLTRDLGVGTARTPRRGDIVLKIGRGRGEEGYALRIRRRVKITAATATGLF